MRASASALAGRVVLVFALAALAPGAAFALSAARLVKDIAVGSDPNVVSDPEEFVELGNLVLFTAENELGRELWRTDGTRDGTVLVLDIAPGPSSSYPFDLTTVGGTVFFSAGEDTTGRELWRSDGTAAGTRPVAYIDPGLPDSHAAQFTWHAGTLYFTADDGVRGAELWRTDGTEEGTSLVADVRIGGPGGSPHELTSAAGWLFFVADDGYHGCELWRSDGTDGGTLMVKDLRPDDGCTVHPSEILSGPRSLVSFDGLLHFFTEDSTLWRSDGTEEGTTPVVRILDGEAVAPAPTQLTVFGGTLLFDAEDGHAGRELWRSDGTASGTGLVADIFPGGAGSSPRSFFNLEDRVYFTAEDGSGRQIWRTDGSAEGTRRITTLAGAGIEVFAWTRLDRSVYFVGSGVEGSGLWRIDDEDRVTPVAPGSYSPRLAAAGRTLVFDNGEPWKSDGTPEGTELLQDVNPYPASSRPEAAADLDGVLLFFAADLDLGRELWRSDGTSEGTTLVADIRAGRRGSIDSVAIPFMTRLGDVVYFAADDGIHGAELWRSDGTASGTYLVADTVPGPEGGLEGIYEIPPADQPEGSVVFFNARTASDESRTKRRRAGPRLMYLCDTGRDFVLPSRKVVAARLPIASS